MARLRLPEALRAELKAPFGPVFTDADVLLAGVDGPIVAVGDVVTAHLERAGRTPEVALVDGRSERAPVDDAVAADIREPDVTVENPAGTITAELVEVIADAIDAEDPVLIAVEGEEDLATLPAILLLSDDASVVYGQPGEGMVHVRVTEDLRERVRGMLERMEGDHDRVLSPVD